MLLAERWELAETTWHTNRTLWVVPRGAAYGIGLFWDDATGAFRGWYLNLQTPLRRTAIGYDLWDHVLDVQIAPDRTWRWKDEDELAWAVEAGVLTPAEAAAARAEGERLVVNLDTLLPTGWEGWRPDPSWPPLSLPAGWDV